MAIALGDRVIFFPPASALLLAAPPLFGWVSVDTEGGFPIVVNWDNGRDQTFDGPLGIGEVKELVPLAPELGLVGRVVVLTEQALVQFSLTATKSRGVVLKAFTVEVSADISFVSVIVKTKDGLYYFIPAAFVQPCPAS